MLDNEQSEADQLTESNQLKAAIDAANSAKWAVYIAAISIVIATFQSCQAKSSLDMQQRVIESQITLDIQSEGRSIVAIFLDKPQLRPYFYEGQVISDVDKSLDGVSQNEVDALAEIYLDFIELFTDGYVRSLPEYGEDEKNWIGWRNYFVYLFQNSPSMCAFFEGRENWYSDNVSTLKEEGCKPAKNKSD